MHDLALATTLHDALAEYEKKTAAAESEVAQFVAAIERMQGAAGILGVFGDSVASKVHAPRVENIQRSLRMSAWRYVYDRLNLRMLMTPSEREKFERDLQNPPDFTMDNLRSTFGDHVSNPRMATLKGLAEVFCSLDNSYKSHSKVRIGIKGLPKRVILTGYSDYIDYRLQQKAMVVINVIRAVQGRALLEHMTVDEIIKGEESFDGLSLKFFKNGNLHILFDKCTCEDINRALAEYYGDVLPDAEGVKGEQHRAKSTAVSKDLQFYPTPVSVANELVDSIYETGISVLEPSCGDGRLIEAVMRKCGNNATVFGYEVDANRAAQCRAKGFKVVKANFLEVQPTPTFDYVIMNPPFYGKHYLSHIEHAIKFLKPGGKLRSILPATAWYDHGKLPDGGSWRDLPVGSFSESGTNVPTGIWTYYRK